MNKSEYIFAQNKKSVTGGIEAITGPMFSGKTEELIRRIVKIEYANKKCLIFKPQLDTRTENNIASRSGFILPATTIDNFGLEYVNAFSYLNGENTVCFDEAQFFNENIIEVVQRLADDGYRVIISGLDMDYKRRPFGYMPYLLSISDTITKLTAVCNSCGEDAIYSKRIAPGDGILIGDKESYEASCRRCYE